MVMRIRERSVVGGRLKSCAQSGNVAGLAASGHPGVFAPFPRTVELRVWTSPGLVGKHRTWVFTFQGDRVGKANNHAWRKALVRAGISNFRWHDLRHTWASWRIQQGTPLYVLQELGGWSDIRMVQRYAHLSADHLTVYADRLSQLRLVSTNPAQRVEVGN